MQAKEARRTQVMIGNPSEKDFKGMVSRNMIKNCPVTTTDITNAHTIFGPDLPSIRGKTVRRTPAPVVADYVAVPRALVEQNKVVTLAADVIFVDGTAFLITVSRRIKFITAEHVQVRTATSLSKHLTCVLQVYGRAGFKVRTILMDGEFEKVRNLMPCVECNMTAAKEHVSEAERTIRTIKERTRGLLATLSFQHLPRRMKIEFINFMVLWLNAFPVKNGLSSMFSPRELLVRWRLDYTKHCRVLPGTYCEVHDEPLPSNTMTPRTHEAIAMGPTGNLQGSVKFFCLNTGRILKRRSFTALPMPDRVIKRVNNIGLRNKQGRMFRFLNRRREPYKWTDSVPEDDPEFQGLLEDAEEAAYPDISAEPPGVEIESEEADFSAVTDDPEPDFEQLAAAALDNAGINPQDRLHAAQAAHTAAEAARAAAAAAFEHRGPALVEANQDEIVYEITFDLPDAGLIGGNAVTVHPPAPVPGANIIDMAHDTVEFLTDTTDTPDAIPTNRRYPLRSCRSAVGHQPYDTYAPRMTFLQLGEVRAHRSVLDATQHMRMTREERLHATTWSDMEPPINDTEHAVDPELLTDSEDEIKVWGYLMTHYNLKPGLRKFGEKGAKAAMDELTQLHIMDTWTAMDPSKITQED